MLSKECWEPGTAIPSEQINVAYKGRISNSSIFPSLIPVLVAVAIQCDILWIIRLLTIGGESSHTWLAAFTIPKSMMLVVEALVPVLVAIIVAKFMAYYESMKSTTMLC